MGKNPVKKKGRSSPRVSSASTSGSNGTSSTTTPSPTVAGGSSSSNVVSEHESVKVQTFDDLIRSDVDAMMKASSTTVATTSVEAAAAPSPAPKWVGAIDQGTSSTRFMIFNNAGQIIASAQTEHDQIYPQPSWHEHDPMQIWKNTLTCLTTVGRAIQNILSSPQNEYLFHTTATTVKEATDETPTHRFLSAIGVTNQRETIVCWNRSTGRPYYNAIVWDDARTADIVNDIHTTCTAEQMQYISQTTGLPISTYFAATKMKWLLDNVEQIRYDIQHRNEQVCFGTIDTWLLYQLTGEVPKSELTKRPLKGHAGLCNTGGIYKTDVTNASRWLFMNLQHCQWDESCISIICGPKYDPYIKIHHNLPEICPSSYPFGHVNVHCGIPSTMYGNIPITGILGDQQAALFGQAAHTKGCAKNTYGTGLFLMMNTGPDIVPPVSTHGLLTTVAYRIGVDGPIYYAYEGSVSHSGSTIQWLRDQIGIISNASESETLARTTSSNDGLYMVPAFGGLLAPHWRNDARGCIVGITALHHKGHICRAALEATAYQTKDVFDAIIKDSNITLSTLNVDGGGTYNKLLMQFQADILNVKVIRPKIMETTSIGVAFAAGLTIGVWTDVTEIQKLWSIDTVFEPRMSEATRNKYISGWKKALSKSFNWITPHGMDEETATEIKNGASGGDTVKAESSERNDKSALQENDLGSSWMVVPNDTSTISSSSSPTVDNTVTVTNTEPQEIPLNAAEEMNLTVPVVSDSSNSHDVVLPTIDEEVKVSLNVSDATIVSTDDSDQGTAVASTKPLLGSERIDSSVNTKSIKEKSGFDLITFISAVGIAFTAGILVTRKR